MERSKALGLEYEYFPSLDLLIFEDGVCYTMREAVICSRTKTPDDLKAVHLVKKTFGGKVFHISDKEMKELEEQAWRDLDHTVVPAAPVVSLPAKKHDVLPDAEILTMEF